MSVSLLLRPTASESLSNCDPFVASRGIGSVAGFPHSVLGASARVTGVRLRAFAGETLIPEKPRVRVKNLGGQSWDLAPDGRILAIVPADASAPPPEHTVVFLQNFFEEVRRRFN